MHHQWHVTYVLFVLEDHAAEYIMNFKVVRHLSGCQTWNRVKPPSRPEPVAATSSGTGRSYIQEDHTMRSEELISTRSLTPFFAREKVISVMGPYAGNESHNERCTTVRLFFAGPAPFVMPLVEGSSKSP